jgi:hypothetical protein
MVNRKRIKRMVPALIVDDSTANKESFRNYMRLRGRFTRLSWMEQEKIVSELQHTLEKVEKRLNRELKVFT